MINMNVLHRIAVLGREIEGLKYEKSALEEEVSEVGINEYIYVYM